MKWSNIREEEYYHMLSMIAIKNDSETLRALVSTVSQPIITLCILPYVSLFCIAVKEYYESCNAGFAISNESPFQVPDIRSKLKLFSDSYSRLEKQILKVDAIQDGEFNNLDYLCKALKNRHFRGYGQPNLLPIYYFCGKSLDMRSTARASRPDGAAHR